MKYKVQDYAEFSKNLKENVVREEIEDWEHLQLPDYNLSSNLNFAADEVRSQYIGLINPNMHLAKVLSKLTSLEPVDDPLNFEVYDPEQIADSLVRFCELNREKSIYAYKHRDTNLVYGVVSPDHVRLDDYDVFQICEAHFKDLPFEGEYEHDIFRSKISYTFPEISIDLGGENSMNFRISVINGFTGRSALKGSAGSYEEWCTNGAMSWINKYNFSQNHIHTTAENMLKKLQRFLTRCLSKADLHMETLRQANEITEKIIKENSSVVKVLRSKKFNLLKREAESVYRRIRSNPRYQRLNGFDLGRAIAEEARDTGTLERQIELEQLAGKVMVSQVS